MKTLTWLFQMLDRVSGPAKSVSTALDGVAKVAHAGGEQFESLQTRMENAFRLGERALHVAEAIGEIGISLGESAIEAASFKETTLVSLETVMGAGREAQAIFADTVALADKLPIKTKQALSIETSFALHGIKDQGVLKRLLIGAADVKGIAGEEGVEAFVRQINDIQSTGLSSRHLQFLSQGAGIGEDRIFAELRKLTGAKGTDEQLKKLVEKHAFDRNTSITAILQALANVQGGALGGLSGKIGQTVEGRLSTLASRSFDFLKDLDRSPGYISFRDFLGKLIDATDPGSPFGKKLSSTIDSTFNGIFTRVFGGDALGNPEEILNRLSGAIADFGAGLQVVEAAGQGLIGGIFDGLNISGDLFGPDGKLDPAKLDKLQKSFHETGMEIDFIVGKIFNLVDAATKLSQDDGFLGDILSGKHGVIAAGSKAAVRGTLNAATGGLFGKAADKTDEAEGALSDFLASGARKVRAFDETATGGRASGALSRFAAYQLGMSSPTVNVTVNAPGATKEDAKVIADHVEDATTKSLDRSHGRPALGGS